MAVRKKDFRMQNLCHPGQGPGIHGYFSAGIGKQLVHVELYSYVNDALRREKQLKGWQRQWRIDLIEQQSPFCFIGLLEAFIHHPRECGDPEDFYFFSGSRVLARDDKNHVQDSWVKQVSKEV